MIVQEQEVRSTVITQAPSGVRSIIFEFTFPEEVLRIKEIRGYNINSRNFYNENVEYSNYDSVSALETISEESISVINNIIK